MTTYRYYSIDPRLRTPIIELPLYGTYMDKVINGAGNFTGTFRLQTGVFKDADLMAGTDPGKYGLICMRDDQIIWAGIIWSRTYASDAKTVQLTAQTYESIFERMPFQEEWGYQNLEQVTILNNFVTYFQSPVVGAGTTYNFGITAPAVAATGINRTVYYDGVKKLPLQSEFLKFISSVEDGCSYSINTITSLGSDIVTLQFQILPDTAIAISDMYFDYPGTISKWWLNENSGSRSGTAHAAVTTTLDGVPVARSTINTDLVTTQNYPYWWEVQTYTDVPSSIAPLTGEAALLSYSAKQSTLLKMPLANPTFELDAKSGFDGWNKIGQKLSVRVQDARFPAGQVFTKRLRGWSLNPANTNQNEIIRLQLEGEEL